MLANHNILMVSSQYNGSVGVAKSEPTLPALAQVMLGGTSATIIAVVVWYR